MILEIKHVSKTYNMAGGTTFKALKDINASFDKGELVSIVGESGSGKSTLMNLIGGLDSSFDGEITYNGENIGDFSEKELVNFHKKSIGFIFQNFNLIPHLSLIDNVAMAMTLSNVDKSVRVERAKKLLTDVGLQDHMTKKPDQISGGQKQRVAIARALMNDPDVIIADEPTGALDSETTDAVLEIIKDIAKRGKLVLMVTHSDRVAAYSSRVVRIDNGAIISDAEQEQLELHTNEDEFKGETPKNLSLWSAIRLAALNMKAKFSRNLLVAIGSSIGIMSVVLMLSLGRGVTSYIKSTMSSYVNPNVTEVHMKAKTSSSASSSSGSSTPTPTAATGSQAQAAQAKEQQTQMAAITGQTGSFAKKDIKKLTNVNHVDSLQKGYTAISLGTNTVSYKGKKASLMQLGTMNSGITASNITKGSKPGKDGILLDKTTADTLGKNIVGKKVKIAIVYNEKTIKKTFKVAGIYEASGSSSSSSLVYLNYTDLQQLVKDNHESIKPNVVYLHTKDKANTAGIKAKVKSLGYTGSIQEKMSEMFTQMLDILTDVLTAVAAISLLVSAIMILVVLNISVVERTKEIGVMKALGARRKDIRRIFVSEAFLIGLASGLIGVGVTYILAFGLNAFSIATFDVTIVKVTASYAFSGILISVLISMFASFLPANRASKLDPVESLRKE
ncbi:ATP-binding cassette domain-containing protein [Dellaglioa sp. BT-FLS60]